MDRLPTPVFLGFSGVSASNEFACKLGDLGSIPGLGRSPGKGNGYPLQYSDLENSTDYILYAVSKSQTQLRDFHITFYSKFNFILLKVFSFIFHFNFKIIILSPAEAQLG